MFNIEKEVFNALAKVDFVIILDKSMPRCTTVCAISGLIPLIIHSAPINLVALTVFIKCCATNESTAGTPEMSSIAIVLSVSTIACNLIDQSKISRGKDKAFRFPGALMVTA